MPRKAESHSFVQPRLLVCLFVCLFFIHNFALDSGEVDGSDEVGADGELMASPDDLDDDDADNSVSSAAGIHS